ncbi:MAG: M3 family oligoendopeptidase [Bacteroidota bacterium]
MESTVIIPAPIPRVYVPANFKIESWDALKPMFDELKARNVDSPADLRAWLADKSELDSVLEEEMAWRYIRMTCNTTDEPIAEAFNFFVTEIEPNVAPYSDAFNRKLVESPAASSLDSESEKLMLRNVSVAIEIFREENIPLLTELQTEQQKYGAIQGAMTVEIDGKELTLQQAGAMLEGPDRVQRERVYLRIQERRLQDSAALDGLFDKLIALRQQVAANAGFTNFRDYMFKAMARFDYSVQDCMNFHTAVSGAVVPLLNSMMQQRRAHLQLDTLRPWDLAVDERGEPPLKPFTGGEELLEKTIECFNRVSPEFGGYLAAMREMGHLDLESRKGKAPGGYNYPLDETGVPFIFMNAAGTLRDLVTLVHEGGHAAHSFLTRDLPLNFYKHPPSEVAELASMSMELISMEHWDVFFTDETQLRTARRRHLEQIIETLPWVATIDQFQHFIYETPDMGAEERRKVWNAICQDFGSSEVNWTGLEQYRSNMWQKQLHLFEVPFYYIEYAIAQLGAVAVWKNYRENPEKGLEGYRNALKLGYTLPIRQIYEAAGIRFDFSYENIQVLMRFVSDEMDKL